MGGKRWRLGMILLAVLVAGVGAGAGYHWYQDPQPAAHAETGPAEPGPSFSVGTVMTNLNEFNPPMYIQVGLQLETDDEAAVQELEQRQGAVRDVVIGVLRAKAYRDVQGAEGMAVVAEEIRAALNELLAKGEIRRVYFTEFIVQ